MNILLFTLLTLLISESLCCQAIAKFKRHWSCTERLTTIEKSCQELGRAIKKPHCPPIFGECIFIQVSLGGEAENDKRTCSKGHTKAGITAYCYIKVEGFDKSQPTPEGFDWDYVRATRVPSVDPNCG
ncbi:hypothetical protein VD0002_g9735 [Verticillium dahliae]|nr:hypothetical protein VD0003_g9926 [Verticillium dahliae]PNH57085.1 hypothetical protein VD0002_g9735 [Verticillium dahliae]